MYSPLEQFTILPIFRLYNSWLDFSISNSTLMGIIGYITLLGIFTLWNTNRKILKNRYEILIEDTYRKIEEIAKEMIPGIYKKYLPLIINLFLVIMISNVIGLIPYSFTIPAQFIVSLTFSLSIIIGVTLLGISKHKFRFILLFVPKGLNQGFIKFLIPLIFFIEIVSYLIRIISLSVRLSANLISGHTLLKILASFGFKLPPFLLFIPVLFLSCIFILEIAVAFIQAYVFTLLTVTYIKDCEFLH